MRCNECGGNMGVGFDHGPECAQVCWGCKVRLVDADTKAALTTRRHPQRNELDLQARIAALESQLATAKQTVAELQSRVVAEQQAKNCQAARIAELECELETAAVALQSALPIGQVKAIGLREVAGGVGQLVRERDKLRAEIKLYNAVTNADSVFAEQTRRVVEAMRAQFDDEWRLKGTGEWRIREIANGVRVLSEHQEANSVATDPAYDEWLAVSGPSYEWGAR